MPFVPLIPAAAVLIPAGGNACHWILRRGIDIQRHAQDCVAVNILFAPLSDISIRGRPHDSVLLPRPDGDRLKTRRAVRGLAFALS